MSKIWKNKQKIVQVVTGTMWHTHAQGMALNAPSLLRMSDITRDIQAHVLILTTRAQQIMTMKYETLRSEGCEAQ